MIKKTLTAAALAGCVAFSAQANLLLDVDAGEGFFLGATDPGVGFLGVDTGNMALIQLWYAADGTIDGGGAGANAGVGAATAVAGGNDIWLMDWVFSEASGSAGDADFHSYAFFDTGSFPTPGGAPPTSYDDLGANTVTAGGVVYGRIFQDEAPTAGDWYFVSDPLAANDLTPGLNPPQVLHLNIDSNGSLGDSLDQTAGHSFQVVPEPGTIALFGLGILTLLGSRRKRS